MLGNFCKWKTKYKGVQSKWKEKSYIDTYIDTTSRKCVWAGGGPRGFHLRGLRVSIASVNKDI